jgi:hypothetical protein
MRRQLGRLALRRLVPEVRRQLVPALRLEAQRRWAPEVRGQLALEAVLAPEVRRPTG